MSKSKVVLVCFAVLLLAVNTQSASRSPQSKVVLESSDARLVQAFNWAKSQAMAYVFDGDPVGPWYEAALPGREAFCMRDVSHQCMGAQALGLSRYTRNMLGRFAENISDSRDWCSYWEINRYNRPAPVDYQNDAEFWYDLPANFDVLDACYRMFLWTGDLAYVENPVFLRFYDRTVSDYVARWSLGVNHVMKRKRLMNVRGEFDPRDKFQVSRGIPGYAEGQHDYVAGVDLLATEYDAFRDYAYIQEYRGNTDAAQAYLKKAAALKTFINTTWWDSKDNRFYGFLNESYQLEGHAGSSLLYYGAADDGVKAQSALNDLLERIKQQPSGAVEGESHYAEILYRYGVPDVAYSQIMDLTRPGRYRQEYPEVSYSVVGAVVTGLMGINLEAPPPRNSSLQPDYVEVVVKTLPGLTKQTAWAELRNLPIRTNEISVRHEGLDKTVFTNQSGPSLIWQATFPGSHDTLLVDGKPVKCRQGTESLGRVTSWVRIPIGAGDTVSVEVPAENR